MFELKTFFYSKYFSQFYCRFLSIINYEKVLLTVDLNGISSLTLNAIIFQTCLYDNNKENFIILLKYFKIRKATLNIL